MTYEASLSVTGSGSGGVHPETIPSFVLAQGDDVPIALVSLFVIRRTRASFREVYFFAGGQSPTEGLLPTTMAEVLAAQEAQSAGMAERWRALPDERWAGALQAPGRARPASVIGAVFDADALILTSDDVGAAFFDPRTGLAGGLFQKANQYGVRLAASMPTRTDTGRA